MPDQTDLDAGCTWTFESPPDTRGNWRIKSISYGSCYDFRVTIWQGNFTGSLQSECSSEKKLRGFVLRARVVGHMSNKNLKK